MKTCFAYALDFRPTEVEAIHTETGIVMLAYTKGKSGVIAMHDETIFTWSFRSKQEAVSVAKSISEFINSIS